MLSLHYCVVHYMNFLIVEDNKTKKVGATEWRREKYKLFQ